ncbi:5-methyltetrahydrofolate--homocysteine methyltransferase [Paracoccus aminovorans]|uniref:5-methyltetrahydrofolate--homocysteine methyltransferase n=1 Tax=Paracoccus aminovorans TaxID=34004 RepID=A0A1I3BVI4_9RHOB|nr:betaine--homocysteine S-methyltransferase [Paracoccus aminovorans]CQR86285.1 5-methyltetrahydrofolate-homocysteinemethyltransferase [Paracoccus aminovorans]SFH66338.1 5-methyltetrahydrofolate--homocysteine methyltransferase [Paracoccus aminovorans]
MPDQLSRMLGERPWLLADGATGTNLYNMGLAPGQAPDLWCESQPDKVRDLHRQMIAAGADIILTNSFGANASRLRLAQAQDRVAALNAAAARLAREAAAESGRPVVVAGSMGPIGEIMAPMGRLTETEATAMFTEQAQALKEGGVDVLWIETVSAAEEMRAAARAAQAVGMPWCGMMSFEPGGRSIMGVAPPQLAALIERLPHPPLAYGANCGTGPAELLLAVAGFAASGNERPLIAKPNAGVPRYQYGGLVYDATPEVMAEFAVLARDMGIRIVGGCCGTTPAHLAAMRDALVGAPRGPRPTPDAISARIAQVMGPGE